MEPPTDDEHDVGQVQPQTDNSAKEEQNKTLQQVIAEEVRKALGTQGVSARSRKRKAESDRDIGETEYDSDEQEQELTDSEEEPSSEVHPKVATYVDSRMTAKVPHEKLKAKLARQARPKNVKYGTETRVNSVIYRKLSKRARMQDRSLMNIQKLTAKSVVATSKIASTVLSMMNSESTEVQGLAKELYNDVFDGITLSCQASYYLNMKRVGPTLDVTIHVIVDCYIH